MCFFLPANMDFLSHWATWGSVTVSVLWFHEKMLTVSK